MDFPTGIGYNVKYEHEVQLNDPAVPLTLVQWCGEHIKHKWGWYFKKEKAYIHPNGEVSPVQEIAVMTFENKKDAFWFSMCKGK